MTTGKWQANKDVGEAGSAWPAVGAGQERRPELEASVLQRLRQTPRSMVVAGHYCLAEHMEELSSKGEPEVMSFAVGAEMVSQARAAGNQSRLVLWVNDIGITMLQREACRHKGLIPDEYRSGLTAAGLVESDVDVLLESAMRNKASTSLRKLYRRAPDLFDKVSPDDPDLVRCVSRSVCSPGDDVEKAGAAYVVDGPNGERLVVKEGSNPKCNLILATFFGELQRRHGPQHIFAVFNDVYVYRLTLGVHVAQAVLGNPVPISLLLCDGERTYAGPNDCIYDDLRTDT